MSTIQLLPKKAIVLAVLLVTLFSITTLFAQVKIGDNPTTIASGSALEIESGTKGLRLPQVSLTSTIVFAPVAGAGTAATSSGMTVYNTNAGITFGTGTNGTVYAASGAGEYYWDGFGWVSKNASTAKGFRIVWAGTSPGPFHSNNNGPVFPLQATEYFDSFNGGVGGVFTVPTDAFYTITQALTVRYNNVSMSDGSFGAFINIKPLSTNVLETRNADGGSPANSNTYSAISNSITLFLRAGDKITFSAQPCLGCVAGSSYDVFKLDQTISIFQ